MRKCLVSVALILAAIAVIPGNASALPISTGLAEGMCRGVWVYNMDTGVRVLRVLPKYRRKTQMRLFCLRLIELRMDRG